MDMREGALIMRKWGWEGLVWVGRGGGVEEAEIERCGENTCRAGDGCEVDTTMKLFDA